MQITDYSNASVAEISGDRKIAVYQDDDLQGFTLEFIRPIAPEEISIPSYQSFDKDNQRLTYISISHEASEALIYLLVERLRSINYKK